MLVNPVLLLGFHSVPFILKEVVLLVVVNATYHSDWIYKLFDFKDFVSSLQFVFVSFAQAISHANQINWVTFQMLI